MLRKDLWVKLCDKNISFLAMLYDRWQDEKEYEDISEYLEVIKKEIPEAYDITDDTFVITFECTDGFMEVSFVEEGTRLKVNCEFL